MAELKPCPFCGGEAKVVVSSTEYGKGIVGWRFGVECQDCPVRLTDSKSNGAMVCLRTNDGFWRKETDFCSYGEYQTNTGGSNNVAD